MKMKLAEAQNRLNAIGSFNKELPVRVHFNLKKNRDLMASDVKRLFEQRQELEKKYLVYDENNAPLFDDNGQLIFDDRNEKTSEDNKKSYINELNELMNCEVEYNFVMLPISLIENLNLTIQEFEAIEFMFNE